MLQRNSKYCTYLYSPIGLLRIYADEHAITGLQFDPNVYYADTNDILHDAKRQLIEYFEGKRKVFELPVKLDGTVFQHQVWNAIADIAYGRSKSYKDIAKQIGNPASVRAVGKCTSLNPIPIIIPCHRILGVQGDLTGYRGGLKRKEWLLQLENPFVQLSLFEQEYRLVK